MSYNYNGNFNNSGSGQDAIVELISWAIIIGCFAFFWPLGIFLLLRKVNKGKIFNSTQSRNTDAKQHRYEKYNSIIAAYRSTGSVPIATLAAAAGVTEAEAIREIQEMMQNRMLGSGAYINYITRSLVLEKAAASEPPKAEASQEAPKTDTSAKKRAAAPKAAASSKAAAKAAVNKLFQDPHKSVKILLLIIGIVLIITGVAAISEPLDWIYWMGLDAFDRSTIWELIKSAGLIIGGGAALGIRGSFSRKTKRYKKYLAVIGDKKIVSIPDLASAVGVSVSTANKDLQLMVDKGLLGPTAYIDVGSSELILSPEAKPETAQPQQHAQDESQYDSILREIRRLNDDIKDEDVSSRIYRIEDVTAKIFKTVEEKPEKLPQIKSFMSYYLPTTLKLLDSYATMEKQGIDGENIASTKSRIEHILDTLVKGFEQQLDQLFKADMLDITSDIDVLESMMAKDGLTEKSSPFHQAGGH